MARHVVVAWAESPEELYQRYTAERDLSRRNRLQALWLVRTGRSVGEASGAWSAGSAGIGRAGWRRCCAGCRVTAHRALRRG